MTDRERPESDGPVLPKWAPRVPREKIWRLYQSDAKGIRDEELVDDVGITLLLRVESCLTVSEAQRGRVKCPQCGSTVHRSMERRRASDPAQILECRDCDWRLPFSDYERTYHNKHLGCAGMLIPCQEFARDYPMARTYEERMVLIDTLIHRFHWEMEGHPGQPGAATIIGGQMSEVAAFLDRLNYGDESTPGISETRKKWREMGKGKAYGAPSVNPPAAVPNGDG